ncbi:MAG TPA: BtpA/SgcQ family protein [Acidimicrobiia bacterium]|nr:BtpA/SgcQ family protein [Acidimicrobiia bacterium]
MTLPSLIGMVHLQPLPGSPRYDGDLDRVLEAAGEDATVLVEAGFPGLLVENFGDAPFFPGPVPPVTVATMTRAVEAVVSASSVPVGVNVLRNDALAAVAIAAVTGASFIRVNVLSGTMFTDQGPITGQAAEVARLRAVLAPELKVLADVFVKHATPPAGLTIGQSAADLWERGGADVLVVSGIGTGAEPSSEDVEKVRLAVPAAPIYLGSGVTTHNLPTLATAANGAIVGTAAKFDGDPYRPVDPHRAREVVAAAAGAGWL